MYTTVLQYLETTTQKFPQKIAYADNNQCITFNDLLNQAKKIGSFISEYVSPHNPVVIYMEKRACNISAFLGAVYAGCYYVPIDAQMPKERVNLILSTLNPSMIIHDGSKSDLHGCFDSNFLTVAYCDTLNSNINNEKLAYIRKFSKNTDLLYVLFTSGSTGIPKGVTISHLAVMDFVDWICDSYELNETTVLCNQAPFYFDASIPDLYIPLKVGATVYIPPKNYYTFPKQILQYINDNHINTLIWVPSALCNVVNCHAFEVTVPSDIRLVIFCGEIMPCKHLNIWKKYIPNALYVNMYGPTEATYACTYYNVDRVFRDDEKLPLGKGCENCEILLLTEDNKVAKYGEIGEICILGSCLSSGYFGIENKTRTSFVQNPINNKWIELMYRTGDLAYIDDSGNMFFAGRKDFQIKKQGRRIELGEIENALLSICGVDSACCIFNELDSNIIAVYTGSINAESIRKILSTKIPNYMIPNKIELLSNLPMNLNGKIDRVRLKREYSEN